MAKKAFFNPEINGDGGNGRKYDQHLTGSWPNLSFLSQPGTAIVCSRCPAVTSILAWRRRDEWNSGNAGGGGVSAVDCDCIIESFEEECLRVQGSKE